MNINKMLTRLSFMHFLTILYVSLHFQVLGFMKFPILNDLKGQCNKYICNSFILYESKIQTEANEDFNKYPDYKVPLSKTFKGKQSQNNSMKYPSLEDKKRMLDIVLAACRSRKPTVSLTDINYAITTAGRLGRIQDALEIFYSIDKLNYVPDLMSYNNIIWSAGNVANIDLAIDLFNTLVNESFRKNSLRPNVYTYGSLMHGCAKGKDYKKALYYLDNMLSKGINPNLVVYTSAIEACSEAGKYQEALRIIERMKPLGLKPDVTLINAAIKGCCISGAIDEAEALADTLREYYEMDLFTYHTLMMGNTKIGRYYRVLSLYETAISSNTRLDGGVYSLAMLAAFNSGTPHLVPRMADHARSNRVKLTEASYTTLIQSYAEAGSSDQAVQCLDQMTKEGLQPNVISYAAAMSACRDKPDVVISLLDRMTSENIEPNTVLLTAAINSLARAGAEYSNRAYELLKSMEANGPEPNIYTYNTITRAFAEVGKLNEAVEVIAKIKERGLLPDQFTFTTLLIACGRSGDSGKVAFIMDLMKTANVIPDTVAFGAAIDAHRRCGDSSKALQCLHDMMKYKLEPSVSHYNLVLRALRAEGLIDKMYKMLIVISKKENAKINANSFELVIEALLEKGDWKQTLILLQIMEKLQIRPSLSIYVGLVGELEKARQYKAVLALYRVMVRDGYDFYENTFLNDGFKRLISVTGSGVKVELSEAFNKLTTSMSHQLKGSILDFSDDKNERDSSDKDEGKETTVIESLL